MKNYIKPFYTVRDFAKILNYTNDGARKFLFRLNIPIHLIGNKFIIYISDLQNHAPEFYASIVEAASINAMLDEEKSRMLDKDLKDQKEFARTNVEHFNKISFY
jgi:hypothetical protein